MPRFMSNLLFCQANSDIEEEVWPFWIAVCNSCTIKYLKNLNSDKIILYLFFLNLSLTMHFNNCVIPSIL